MTGPRTSRRLWILLPALLALWIGLSGARCLAHPANFASATAKIGSDRTFTVEARFDLLAFALNDTPFRIGDAPMNALLDGPAPALQAQLTEASTRFRNDFQADGGVVDGVTFPTLSEVQAWRDSGQLPRLPVMETITVTGHLNPDAKTIAFRFPKVLGMVVLTTEVPYQEPDSEPLDGGALSTPVSVTPGAPPAPAAPAPLTPATPTPLTTQTKPATSVKPTLQAKASQKPAIAKATVSAAKTSEAKLVTAKPSVVPPLMTGSPVTPAKIVSPPAVSATLPSIQVKPSEAVTKAMGAPTQPSASIKAVVAMAPPAFSQTQASSIPEAPRRSWTKELIGFVKMGFTHILPEGLDHILFVLGLFLLSTKAKPLLWQITAFTIAHSLTLGLSLYGVVRLPSSIVEPIIAASIAFVAIENICTTELKPWRPFVVFAFGLVHGMGFAGALKDLGLQKHDFLTALVGFNVGVELGQLSVVALAFLCVGWFRKSASYRKVVVVPASLIIAAVAIFWTIQRTI